MVTLSKIEAHKRKVASGYLDYYFGEANRERLDAWFSFFDSLRSAAHQFLTHATAPAQKQQAQELLCAVDKVATLFSEQLTLFLTVDLPNLLATTAASDLPSTAGRWLAMAVRDLDPDGQPRIPQLPRPSGRSRKKKSARSNSRRTAL